MSVSVLMSVYFNDNFNDFKLSLDSILNQYFKPNEIVIVFDGPVNSDIISYIENKISEGNNIIIVKIDVNSGLGNALNKGLDYCKNEFIARMDSDDISLPNRLFMQYKILEENPEIAIVGSYMLEFNENPQLISHLRKLPLDHENIIKFSKFRNPFNHPTVMYRKSVIMSVGAYDNILLFEDYFLWLKVFKAGFRSKNISTPLLYFRMKNFVNRRSGHNYFFKELQFYKHVYQKELLPSKYILISLALKLPLRILPLFVNKFIYHKILRKNIEN